MIIKKLVTITTADFTFLDVPDSVSAGLTTFFIQNEASQSNEIILEKLGADLPAWYWSVEFIGGSGIIPAGYSTDVSLNLEPGTYSLECYMKTEDGEMHNMEGMMREVTVTDTRSEATPPDADINIMLSNFEMAIDGDLTPGSHMVAVNVEEHPEEGFGHNVHVTRIDQDTDTDNLVRWMNFLEIDGLQNPGPATFVGGMQILPEGKTGYFSLDLEPGRYLFVSVPTARFDQEGKINSKTMDMARVDETAELGATEIWEINNLVGMDHPFHLHGYQFQVFERNGEPVSQTKWEDTVNVPGFENARFIVRYDNYPGKWMFHCHILDHEDQGMMGVLEVK